MSTNKNTLFNTPFSTTYWKNAKLELHSIKMLILASLFISLQIVISSFFIPVPSLGTIRIYFTFLVISLGSLIYGPILAILVAIVSDTLGYLIHPQGAYFIGYCLTGIVSNLLYALFFYQTKITLMKIFICKLLVNIFANIILNGLWDSILSGANYTALILTRIPKNLILLPFEVIMIYFLFKTMLPLLKQHNLIKEIPFQGKIPFF